MTRILVSALAAAVIALPLVSGQFVANVVDYGADPTGATKATTAVVAALKAVEGAGGGILYFPPGTYLVTPFNLTSHLEVRLDAATLKASDDFGDWDGKPFADYVAYRAKELDKYDEEIGGTSMQKTKERFAEFL